MRRRLEGPDAVLGSLSRDEPVRLILASREPTDPSVEEALAAATAKGIRVRLVSRAVLFRFTGGSPPAEILALVGAPADADLSEVLALRGAVWLFSGVRYPTNLAFLLRTAEVSGADAAVIDAELPPAGRRHALRSSMRADRFLPVFFLDSIPLLDTARQAGHRLIAVEDVGSHLPWETDLTGPVVLVVGAEHDGIPTGVLEACDETVRIPMAGFIPSHNVQAAMSVVAVERLRQQTPDRVQR